MESIVLPWHTHADVAISPQWYGSSAGAVRCQVAEKVTIILLLLLISYINHVLYVYYIYIYI